MRYLLIGLLGLLTLGIVYSCQKETSIEYGTAAKGSLQSSAGDCLPKTLAGTYAASKPLNDSNYIEVTVNVTTAGPYTIFTDTVNGYAFKATGTFSNTGSNTVRLKGGGTPAIAGTDDFTVFFDSSFCDISVPVGGSGSGGTGCGTAVVQGAYTAGTAVAGTNTVTLTHTYATAGNYAVSTNTVNGYSFGPTSYTATAGSNTVTLTATGKPTAAGTNSFSIDFGDGQTCSFTVTVGSGTVTANTDYFPTTQGSYWTYDDVQNSDTFKLTVNGTQSITSSGNTQTYQKFVYSDAVGPFYTEYYRKDATTGFYYQSFDTTGYGFGQAGITLSQAKFDVLFLKNTLATGATWTTDIAATYSGLPTTIRFAYTCVDANASKTVNGKTFTSVYKVQYKIQANVANSGFQDVAGPFTSYYAKGVGLISADDESNAPVQNIRYWQVN